MELYREEMYTVLGVILVACFFSICEGYANAYYPEIDPPI